MPVDSPTFRRKRRSPKPIDHARLEEIALAYVARFATSAARFEAYLRRKLRERGWEGETEPDLAALSSRFVELGYIDDEAYARSRANGLLRRGYGPCRIEQALGASGIDEDLREAVSASESAKRRAALTLARKRGFGPYAAEPVDRARREKQLAAMLRAGHSFTIAHAVLDAADCAEIEEWAMAPDTGNDG